VTVIVFYDENGDGRLDPSEVVRLPGVEVVVGSASARSEGGSGRATVMAEAGAQAVAIGDGSLPPYYVAPRMITVQVPASQDIPLPVTLPIGDHRPNVYMAFGDSITVGDGSSDGTGYRNRFDHLLRPYLNAGDTENEGASGTQTDEGADRVLRALRRRNPAYTLINYGTNDWNTLECQQAAPCDTIDEMRRLVDEVKASGSLPIMSTIIPTNPTFNPAARNEWVAQQNVFLRALAREEGAPFAEIEEPFLAAGDLPHLFADAIHPNDLGYQIMAEAFFKAVTDPRGTAGSFVGRSPGRLSLLRRPGD
jgi:lysophospholipase L1-like esterase